MIRIGCGTFDEASRAHLTGTAIHWSIRAGWRHSPVANRLGVNNPTRSTHAGHSLAYGTTQIIGKLLVLLKHRQALARECRHLRIARLRS